MALTHINPDGMHKNPAFSQGIAVDPGKTIYVGGQNGILPDGTLAGSDLTSQTVQAYKNVLEVLKAAGASQPDVAKLTIFVVKGQDVMEGFAASQKAWGNFPTAISVLFVEGLGLPGALVEIEAIASVAA
jgi:2-iminobutanoate/2-iminopropanoate deaminase